MLRELLLRIFSWTMVLLAVGGIAAGVVVMKRAARETDPLAARGPGIAAAPVVALPVADSLLGFSGQLRFRTLDAARAAALPGFVRAFGEGAIRTPAVHLAAVRGSTIPFAYIVIRGFGAKRGDFLDGYTLGRWPNEKWIMAKNYGNPEGFIQVTPENRDVALSPHFHLGDFVTHDQQNVWPKYVVLREPLIDKLELVAQELEARRIHARRIVVLSGFRSPQYNERGVDEGMARASRHQYGDAADVIVDDDGDGRMDDLNHDGKVDLADTEVILHAVERIEFRYPEYKGGLGQYHAMGPHGPFAHIDVRGTVARWGR